MTPGPRIVAPPTQAPFQFGYLASSNACAPDSETIVASADGKAALDKVVPGLTAHPQFEAFKGLSLRQLQPYSEGKITDDVLKAADIELAKVKS